MYHKRYDKHNKESYGYELSVVIPIFNEEQTIEEVYEKVTDVLSKHYPKYEIIFVEDGSSDHSFVLLGEIAKRDKKIKIIRFRRNFGQTAALMAGIQYANAPVIVTMDGDLQNEPNDIPLLVNKLKEGYDLVSGWRKNRKDSFILRKIPSWVANRIISKLAGVKLHDCGCTLKAYKAAVIKSINLYGEMHRFIPAVIAKEGGRVTEVVVRHYPRTKGKSKYGIERVLKVLFDLFLFRFMSGYASRPIHFFGFFSLAAMILGAIVGIKTLYERFILGLPGINLLPLVLLTMFFILLGVQTMLIGLLAEIGIRTYYESQGRQTYVVEQIINEDL
jgi:glycosyltransferase involved in cell wall biosynthesis